MCFFKLKQCPYLVKNATIVCVEHVHSLATVDEEFQHSLSITPCENKYGPRSPMEKQTITKSGQICQQEDGNLGRGHCSSFGTHYVWWHCMYYIMTSVPLLQNVMPSIPWSHNNEEANIVVATIRNMEKTFPA